MAIIFKRVVRDNPIKIASICLLSMMAASVVLK